jgi:mRNA interferase RelE/StbE
VPLKSRGNTIDVMSQWRWEFGKETESDLSKLDRPIRRRVIERLDWLCENFDTIIPISLGEDYREFYKLRVGDWRVVYKIAWEEKMLTVSYIDHRSKAYRKRK